MTTEAQEKSFDQPDTPKNVVTGRGGSVVKDGFGNPVRNPDPTSSEGRALQAAATSRRRRRRRGF